MRVSPLRSRPVVVPRVQAFLRAAVDVQAGVHEGEAEHHGDEQDVGDPEDPDLPRRARVLRIDVHRKSAKFSLAPGWHSRAGGDHVLLGDGALRIGGRQDAVAAVAVAADGGLRVAEHEGLAVVAVEVRRLRVRVALGAHRHRLRAERIGARRDDVVRVVAVGAERRLVGVLGEHQVPVERLLVHLVFLAVAVAAGADLGRPQPALGDALGVHPGVEAEVATDAGQLAVARVGLDVPVDVDALLLAVDVDVRRHLLAVDGDGAVDRLLAVAREALLVAARAHGRAAGARGAGAGPLESAAATPASRPRPPTSTAPARTSASEARRRLTGTSPPLRSSRGTRHTCPAGGTRGRP